MIDELKEGAANMEEDRNSVENGSWVQRE